MTSNPRSVRSTVESGTQPSKLFVPLAVLASIAALAVLYIAAGAFIPIAMAMLLALILSAPVEALHRWKVPRGLSATLILLVAVAAFAGLLQLVWTPTQQWFASAPRTMSIIKEKVTPIARFMSKVEELRQNVGTIAAARGKGAAPARAVIADSNGADVFLVATREVIAGIVTCIIVTLFLLAGGPPMMARMTAAFADDLNATHVLNVIEKVRAEVGLYYATTGAINVSVGCVTAAAMAAWGMPTPYLWGAMAALLCFIPYLGSAVTLLALTGVALVTFDHLAPVLGVAITYLVIATIEGQVLQPLLVGRRLEINPLHIFLGLWFGGFFWGIAGILLATPALLALKVTAENARNGHALLEFLGPNEVTVEEYSPLLRRFTDRTAKAAGPASKANPV